MSSHYEVVFTCFLRDDTPESVLKSLRWHLGLHGERPPGLDENVHQLLAPDPDSYLPGGDFASLRRQFRWSGPGGEHHAWGLFSRNYWLDDDLGHLVTVLGLLAPYVDEPGYGGYFREEYEAEPTVFVFRDGGYDMLSR